MTRGDHKSITKPLQNRKHAILTPPNIGKGEVMGKEECKNNWRRGRKINLQKRYQCVEVGSKDRGKE